MSYPNPPAAPTPKKTSGGKIAALGCGGLVLLVIIIGVVGAALSSKTKTSNTSADANPTVGISTTKVITTSATPAAPATTKAAAPKTTTGAPPKPATVLTLKGNGIKNSPRFTTGDNWTIHYSYDCTKTFGAQGNFTVYVDYPNGDIPVNELGAKGSDTSTATGAGTHTLKVASECSWKLTITNDQ